MRRHGRPRRPLVLVIAAVLALGAAACAGPVNGSSGHETASASGGGTGDGGGEDPTANLPECPVDALDGVTAADPVHVTVWHAYVAKTEQALNDLADEYNASQDKVVVDVESQGTSYRELQRKYNQAATTDPPAMFIAEDIQNQAMADSSTILPLTSCLAADDSVNTDDWLPIAIDYYTINGVTWPVSMNVSTPILYYNRKHFEQAGLDPDDPPTTIDEMIHDAQVIKDAGVSETPWVQVASPSFIESWMTGAGETMVDNGNGRDAPATAATLEGNDTLLELFTKLKGAVDDGLLNALPDTDGQINQYLALGTQNASFGIETSTAATSVEAFLKGNLDTSQLSDDGRISADVDLSGLDIDAAPLPGITDPGRPQVGGGIWLISNQTSPEVQAGAWDFAKFINTKQSQITNDLEGSYMPLLSTAANSAQVQDTWTNTLSGQWLATAYSQLTEGVNPDFPGINLGPYTEFRKAIQDALEAMYFNGTSPADAIATAQGSVDDEIQQYATENF